jgi:hypothetical protein
MIKHGIVTTQPKNKWRNTTDQESKEMSNKMCGKSSKRRICLRKKVHQVYMNFQNQA